MSDRPPDKSNFLQTCSLLGQFFNGKVTLRDLSLVLASKVEAPGKPEDYRASATMGFLGNLQKSSQTTQQVMAPPMETKTAQLTIFYAGKLMVVDDFPADKAREIVLMASKGCPQSGCGVFPAASVRTAAASAVPHPKPVTTPPPPPFPLQHAGSTGSDLPIARRSSLHRFLEKRKDRATTRAPYQVHNNTTLPSYSNHNEDSSSSKSKNDLIDLNFKL